ncbi:MAG: site-specific integrase [Bosea sp.]|uniref:tyrosine-type recombinase/integrase n=1 Tax=Bosea sp. (in: a-proteobacteria) TaxID=1871050 RepID=UPI001AC2952E|nr:site-specific integrase [Bosea sp. (in: a-proteobacteria)]MBN9453999.1 site-specific integrase [Bosea sp. (in: a-proteobacteria)]
MATIRKHRDKFQVRIRRKDAPALTRTFAAFSDAKEWATLQERKADRGELGADRKELERITLAKLVERYRDEVLPMKKAETVERYILNAFLRHPICKKRLSDLTTADFAAYRDQRLREISPASLKRQLTPVRNMFKVARMEWDIPLASNPLNGLTLKARDNMRERRLQDGEYEKLTASLAKTRNPLLAPIVRLALATAMRRGEILALRLRDVDLPRKTAIIREAKNGHSRSIPLTSAAIQAVQEAIALTLPGTGDRLFPIAPAALREAWDCATSRAELEDLHFHDLRHEAISRLFELGLTVPEVASVSGHRTMSQLMRYAHANAHSLRAKLDSAPSR